ncbi:hypothetical protein [Ralstonia sp.]|uniref:hypothetical protein n=1 Tax=Ralstonia sp. TaxID=54061 RepID=UPI002CAA97FA|nr:hypothetical protein [Ralstonia sp.]HWV04931.1 hypothetical protein [Ralstonia sp.]
MSLDAYKIGIQIALVDNVSRGLLAIAAQFESVNKSAEKLETRLEKVKKLTEFGTGLFKAGNEAVHMWDKQVDAASKYHAALERISRFDPGAATANEKFLRGLDIKGMSLTDVGQLFGGAQTILQNSTQAQDVTKLLAQARTAFGAATGVKDGTQLDSMALSALKVAQMRDGVIGGDGKIDTKKVEETFNMLVNTAMASGGGVLPKDYLEAMQGGKVSGALKPSEAAAFGLKQFMQANGGSKAGIDAVSALQGWAVGSMPATVAHELERVKLLDSRGVHRDKAGRITSVDATGMTDAPAFIENPLQYVTSVIVPALQKSGFSGDALNTKLGSLLGMKDEKNILEQLQRDKERAGLYLENARKGPGAVKLYEKENEGFEGKLKDYEAKKTNLNIALGEHVLPLAIAGLEKFNGLIGNITHLAQEFPGVTTAVMVFVTALKFIKSAASSLPTLGGEAGGGFLGSSFTRAAAGLLTGPVARVVGAGMVGWGIGTALRGPADSAIRSMTGGKKSQLWDFITGVDRTKLVATGGYTQAELDSVKSGGGVKLTAGARERLDSGELGRAWFRRSIAGPQQPEQRSDIKLVLRDGRLLADVVFDHLQSNLARPQIGASDFNSRMNLMPSGF